MRNAQPGTAAKLRLAQPIAAVLCFFEKAMMTDRDVWLEITRGGIVFLWREMP